jgi:hypothetical protein
MTYPVLTCPIQVPAAGMSVSLEWPASFGGLAAGISFQRNQVCDRLGPLRRSAAR